MNFLASIAIALIFVVNLLLAPAAWADPPRYTTNPDYIEVTEILNNLLMAQNTQTQEINYTPEQLQNKIAELQLQKYTLESGINWAQCRNQTGKTLAVYGPKAKKSDSAYDNGLYFLADGETTAEEWDCEGVYLPNNSRASYLNTLNGRGEELAGAVAVKILDGNQLVAKTNRDTGAVELNLAPANVFKAGEANWYIPEVSQEIIDARVPNAPTQSAAEID